MTDRLYLADPYLQTFHARVVDRLGVEAAEISVSSPTRGKPIVGAYDPAVDAQGVAARQTRRRQSGQRLAVESLRSILREQAGLPALGPSGGMQQAKRLDESVRVALDWLDSYNTATCGKGAGAPQLTAPARRNAFGQVS